MREVKFRAWDKKWARWILPSDLCMYGNGSGWGDRRADPEGDTIESVELRDLCVEQYTGLHDKNGREIYEGDLLAIDDPDEPDRPAVEWHDGAWRKRYLDWDETLSMPILSQEEINLCCYEVVGNIHENHELLEAPNA